MKKAISIALLLAVTHALSQEDAGRGTSSLTNGLIVSKGVRGPAGGPAYLRLSPVAAHSAIRRLKEIQNSDGSWGASGAQQLATAFALISFMRNGESRASTDYGRTVQAAYEWLLKSNPKTDPEHVATAIALSDYMTVHYRPDYHGGADRPAIPEAEMKKLKSCVAAISAQCDEMWRDLLIGSRMPEELGQDIDRDMWLALQKKYLEHEPPRAPSSLDDYLLLCLCGRATFHEGGKVWTTFNHEVMPILLERRDPDGLFACKPESDRIPATGLAVMNCTVYYQTAHRFSPQVRQKETTGDSEIKINR